MDIRKWIKVVGAREHNLKNITVAIPKDSLTVITGPSGSGKSSLALDVLYAEGQRRYIESLSAYARQFLGLPKKPDIDRIEGLCPAIAIDQKTVGHNPRSTVGTITEIADYLRVLFARIGVIFCPGCDQKIQPQSIEAIAESLLKDFKNMFITIVAPLALEKKGEFGAELERLFKLGYYQYRIDGQRIELSSIDDCRRLALRKNIRHSIDIVLDTLEVHEEEIARLHEALQAAFMLSGSLCKVMVGGQEHLYSSARMCLSCRISFPELEPRFFSFNSPLGACAQCQGLGVSMTLDSTLWYREQASESGFRVDGERPCSSCQGHRLHDKARAVKVGGYTLWQLGQLSLEQLLLFFKTVSLSDDQKNVADRLFEEIGNRLTFLVDVGVGYLSLNRTARTLSGGEGQRIRLATQIGSALSGVLYILDEPSIGLHQRDNDRLIATLKRLRDQGNTVLVVEHDTDTMQEADYLIDMGPAAGIQGGNVIAAGSPAEVMAHPASLTGAYLAGRNSIEVPKQRRTALGFITLKSACKNNLKNIDVSFPLGVLCGISGVSGSGKSTLVMDELVPTLTTALAHRRRSIEMTRIEGIDQIDALVVIDQSPLGRTCRSTPATYLGIFDDIRNLFAQLPESNARGYTSGRFSFNVKEGRCSECHGEGVITVSMHLLPDVSLTCSRCKGTRYSTQTLDIRYKNKNIADILAMTAYEAADFFSAHTGLAKRLRLLCDVGLDYLTLGQPSTTLSGGEAQRVKLVYELAKRGHKTLYVLDEPTTGLHQSDIAKLLKVFDRLLGKGNSLLIIEHNLDVLKTADYLLDLGPDGGDKGGYIVASGTPEVIAACPDSYTGRYLKNCLRGRVAL